PEPEMYTVRKDNTISWKSNLYTLPIGSYKGQGTQVMVRDEQGDLIIADDQGVEICRHKVCFEKGQIISNTDHKREKNGRIGELLKQVAQCFDDAQKAENYLLNIRQEKPRYIRDQLIAIKSVLKQTDKHTANKTLDFCCENNVFSASDFKSVAEKYVRDKLGEVKQEESREIKTINRQGNSDIQQPAISSIIDYESIMKNKN
ncbi:MAG: hypothetical protein KAQ62_05300, partial [Cyclobacteriaceae bacterium]|nr:hypothetical protein [Cyclobacteriaceae bacterium]